MNTPFARPRIDDRWSSGAPGTDDLDQLVYLSNLIGRDTRLVQPGGGNTSIKVRPAGGSGGPDVLLVKGSGTDLATIGRAGFTPLALARLNALRDAPTMDDGDMMRFMASCMLPEGGPAPSVETPLHSLLPHRVIAHTHDIATMSLTNVRDSVAERLVTEIFAGEIVYVPYVRPGFPLAAAVAQMVDDLPTAARGLALAHHGLVVWGDDARACYATLVRMIGRMEEYLETVRRGRPRPADTGRPRFDREARARCAEALLPAVRGALSDPERVVLHFDDDSDVLAALGSDGIRERAARGVATPEHVLRAGRLPLWLDVDPAAPAEQLVTAAREQLAAQRRAYLDYHRRHATAGQEPLADWAKVVLVPDLGMITAFRDKTSAVTANTCYRAVLETIGNAEAVDEFRFLPEADVFEVEHWPLERRKVDEQIARERSTLLLPRHVAVVIGGGSGIGKAAAERFAAQGAHVVVADLDAGAAEAVAHGIAVERRGRAIGRRVDVRDDGSLAALFRDAVLAFGGVDCLFYTAGLAPRFAPLTDLTRGDLQAQLDVHYLGAVGAMRAAAQVMLRQQRGGAIVVSVSKAAMVPGRDALAYGASKAALLQALRVAAVELGPAGIRVNAINADQIDTPMFRRFVEERAAARGLSVDQQLAAYRDRNVMGVSLIPASAVAELAVLLASDRFQYTTGDVLTVDGGLPEAFPR